MEDFAEGALDLSLDPARRKLELSAGSLFQAFYVAFEEDGVESSKVFLRAISVKRLCAFWGINEKGEEIKNTEKIMVRRARHPNVYDFIRSNIEELKTLDSNLVDKDNPLTYFQKHFRALLNNFAAESEIAVSDVLVEICETLGDLGVNRENVEKFTTPETLEKFLKNLASETDGEVATNVLNLFMHHRRGFTQDIGPHQFAFLWKNACVNLPKSVKQDTVTSPTMSR